MELSELIKPELVVVAAACYLIGMGLKNTNLIKDKLIPLVLGGVGVFLSCVWVFATSPLMTPQDWGLALFAGITQGVLTAGLSTYAHQLVKQMKKGE